MGHRLDMAELEIGRLEKQIDTMQEEIEAMRKDQGKNHLQRAREAAGRYRKLWAETAMSSRPGDDPLETTSEKHLTISNPWPLINAINDMANAVLEDEPKAGPKIQITLHGYTPPSLNKVKTRPGMAARTSDRLAAELTVRAYQAGWRRSNGFFGAVHATLLFPTKRRVDEDNYRKILKDALVKADLVKDDSVQDLRFHLTVQTGTGRRETWLTLSDTCIR